MASDEVPLSAVSPAIGGERRLAFGLLCLLIVGTASFYREFSYLSLPGPGLRLYITELILGSVLLLLLHETTRLGRFRLRVEAPTLYATVYLLWGAICFLRGRQDGAIALREFAVAYYALVFILLFGVLATGKDVTRVWSCVLLGTGVAFIVVVLRVFAGAASATSTGALRFHAPVAVGAAGVLYWCLAAPAITSGRRLMHGCGVLLSAAVIVVATQHRSAALALAVSLGAWLLWLHRGRSSASIGSRRTTMRILSIGIVALLLVPELASVTIGRLRTIGTNIDDFNSAWRLLYWSILLAAALRSPVFGYGFGDNLPAFHFRGVTYGADPSTVAGVHNSFLFVFYKEGIVGLLLLMAFLVCILAKVHRAIQSPESPKAAWRQAAATGALIFVCGFACFNVVLEGPYMGIFFWLYAALATVPGGGEVRQL